MGKSEKQSAKLRPKIYIVRIPGPPLLFSRPMNTVRSLHGLNIQIRDVRLAITAGQSHANLKLAVEHHIILAKPALAIVDAKHALLHLHFLSVASPGCGVVLPLLAAIGSGAVDLNTALGECETWTAMAGNFGDSSGSCSVGGRSVVTTPGLQRSADTPGMC